MQIEAVTAFVNVNQRNDIGPPCRIHCADVGDRSLRKSRVHIRHEALARCIWPRGSGGGRWAFRRWCSVARCSRVASCWITIGAAFTGDREMPHNFLIDTYESERIKVVSVWSEFTDDDLPVHPRPDDSRGRSVHEQMVHQCVSEDFWFRGMLGIDGNAPPLPKQETRLEFIERYAEGQVENASLPFARSRRLVGGRDDVLRHAARACVGNDAAAHPHVAPSWPAHGHAAGDRP